MDITLTILSSLLIGVVASIPAAKYYYKKSVQKRLTPYLVYSSKLFEHLDRSIKSKLTVNYEGKKIDNLYELRFIVVNEGEKPISKPIKPLTLSIQNGEVIDAVIEQIHPDGRKVNIETSGNIITFDIDLLNKDEKFLIYILINGEIQGEDYEFTIVEEELPPKLKIRNVRFEQMTHNLSKNEGTDYGFIIFFSIIFIYIWLLAFMFAAMALLIMPWTELTNLYFQQMLTNAGITSENAYYESLNSWLLRSGLSIASLLISGLFLKVALAITKDAYVSYTKIRKIWL